MAAGGISRDNLSELTVYALSRASRLGSGGLTRLVDFNTRSVDFTEFKNYLTLSSTQTKDPLEKDMIDQALRLLAVAETANRLRSS